MITVEHLTKLSTDRSRSKGSEKDWITDTSGNMRSIMRIC